MKYSLYLPQPSPGSPVDHSVLVEVLHHAGHLVHHGPGLALREELLPEDFVQKLSASHQLEDEEDLVLLLEHVPQADDVGMLPVAEQDLNLMTTDEGDMVTVLIMMVMIWVLI